MWDANSRVSGWLEMLHLKNQIQLKQLITEVRDQCSARSIPRYFAAKNKLSECTISWPINKLICPNKKASGSRTWEAWSRDKAFPRESKYLSLVPGFSLFFVYCGTNVLPLCLFPHLPVRWKWKKECCGVKFNDCKRLWDLLDVLLWTENTASACYS